MFFIIFISIFIAAQSLYYYSRQFDVAWYLQSMNTQICSAIINTITPHEKTISLGNAIRSGHVTLTIAWGCEGMEGVFMIIAALTAFSMRRKWKLWGILAGTAFVLSLNIVRLILLFYTYKYKPDMFDIMHVYVGQTFIIFFSVLFFIFWISMFSPGKQRPST